MALASQMARTNAAGRVSAGGFRKRSSLAGRRLVGLLLLVLVLGGGGYMLVRSRDGAGGPGAGSGGGVGGGSGLGPAAASAAGTKGDFIPPSANPMTRPGTPASSFAVTPPRTAADVEMTAARPQPTAAAASPRGEVVRDPLNGPDSGATAAPSSGQPADLPRAASTQSLPAAEPPVSSEVRPWMIEAEQLQSAGKLVQARAVLNVALRDQATRESDRVALRRWLTELNESLIFSPTVYAGEPFTEAYTVTKGDSLPVITRKLSLHPEFMFLARVNRMANPNRLSVGQKLKAVRGPFHAVVDKSEYRLDLYAGEAPETPAAVEGALRSNWTFIRSFTVGLGEGDSTPVGLFVVRTGSKLVNPFWRNPRTGETFQPDDPKNPIGERWIGLDGFDDASAGHTGYGIHGTVDPASIGRQMSMGCVRLGAEDIELLYDLLTPRVSVVKIVP